MMHETENIEERNVDTAAQISFKRKTPEERKRIREKIFLERKAVFDALARM